MENNDVRPVWRLAINRLFGLINAVAWVCFVTMIAVMLLQVFTRYVIHHPLPWTEELSRFSYIWAIFLGSIIAQRSKSHMTVTILLERLPAKVAKVFELFAGAFSVGVMCVVFAGTVKMMGRTYGILASSIPVSYTYIYLALLIGSGGMVLLLIASFVKDVRELLASDSNA